MDRQSPLEDPPESAALDDLVPEVYEELYRLASRQMRGERRDHTLQTAGLVNEAYLRLADQRRSTWNDRSHFFKIASRIMRRVLVDHARRHASLKRGGEFDRLSLDHVLDWAGDGDPDLLELDAALDELTQVESEQAQVVELKFFGGLSNNEIAEALGVSVTTVKRRWRVARAWLYRNLRPPEPAGGA